MAEISVMRLAIGFALALLTASAARAARLLTWSGAAAAAIMGTIVFGLDGWSSAAPLLAFFLTSSGLSLLRRRSKSNLGFENAGRRDGAQVAANGGIATLCVLAPFLVAGIPWRFAHIVFLAALAAANADTWATEIGAAWGGAPYLITNWRRVDRGASGGVTVAGLAAALLGAAVLGAFAWTRGGFVLVTAAGMIGALCDSVLGATLQAQWRDSSERLTERSRPRPPAQGLSWMRNDMVNLLCTLSSAIVAATVLCMRSYH